MNLEENGNGVAMREPWALKWLPSSFIWLAVHFTGQRTALAARRFSPAFHVSWLSYNVLLNHEQSVYGFQRKCQPLQVKFFQAMLRNFFK